MADEKTNAELQSGVAFRLQPDGQWKPEKIPPEVLKEAEFSGYLTIQGYRCTVFETPDKNQWAQKSTGTPAGPEVTTSAKIAEQWLESHGVKPPPVQSMRSIVTSRVASTGVKCVDVQLREHDPVGVDSVYPTYDGRFTFSLPDGRTVVFDGRLDASDQNGTMTVDGEDVSDQLWAEPGDYASLEFLGLETNLDEVLQECIQAKPAVASQIAARWLRAQGDVTSLVQKKLDRSGEDKDYDKAIVDFVTKSRNKLPPIDAALSKACDILLNTRDKIEHKHPKVQDHYVQMFLQELAQKHRELEDIRKQLMRALTVELDRYESEANMVGDFEP